MPNASSKLNFRFGIWIGWAAIAGALLLTSCGLSPSFFSKPTATASITVTPSPTDTSTPTPSATHSPTSTPTITPSPTNTLTPTSTSVFVLSPVQVDLSDPEHIGRPRLSGTVRVADTRHFRIFYTLSGKDAVQIEDQNGDAVPDYVESVALALEYAWTAEIVDLGWNPPPSDFGRGGDDRYDVYLVDLDNSMAGYVNKPDIPLPGDNPDTPEKEVNAAVSFLVLDNDFQEAQEMGISLSTTELIQTTIAHEFNHVLQNGYDSMEPLAWLWESTATWMETVLYPEITDSNFYLWASFKSADSCALAYGGRDRVEDAGNWYAKWLLLEFIAETYGDTAIERIWSQAISLDGYDALDQALAHYDTDFDTAFRGYTVALLLRDFEFALDYPTVRLEGKINDYETFKPRDGVWQGGADFVEIARDGVLEVSLRGLEDGTLVGIREDQADIYILKDKKTVIDTGNYAHVYLIVYNLARAQTMLDCREKQYMIVVRPGENPQSADTTIPSPQFLPPSVEELLDPGS